MGNSTTPFFLLDLVDNHEEIVVGWAAFVVMLLLVVLTVALQKIGWTHEDGGPRVVRLLLVAAAVYGVSAESGWVPRFGERRVNIPLVLLNAYLMSTVVGEGGLRVFGAAMPAHNTELARAYFSSAQLVLALGAPVSGAVVYIPFVIGLALMLPPFWWYAGVLRTTSAGSSMRRRTAWIAIAVLITVVNSLMLLFSQAYIGRVSIAGGIANMLLIHTIMMFFLLYTEKQFAVSAGSVSYSEDLECE